MEGCEYAFWELERFRSIMYLFMLAIFAWEKSDDVLFFLEIHEPR